MSVIEATELIELCTLLQKNKTLGEEKKALNVGFIRSCVVVEAPEPRGEEDTAWLILNTSLLKPFVCSTTNP